MVTAGVAGVSATTGAAASGLGVSTDIATLPPLATTGVVAAIALFLAREPIMDLAGKATDKVRSRRTRKPKTKSTEKVA